VDRGQLLDRAAERAVDRVGYIEFIAALEAALDARRPAGTGV